MAYSFIAYGEKEWNQCKGSSWRRYLVVKLEIQIIFVFGVFVCRNSHAKYKLKSIEIMYSFDFGEEKIVWMILNMNVNHEWDDELK